MAVITRAKSTVYGLVGDLNNIKNAGGFDTNLNYLSIPTANYISGATSVRHATDLLDSKAKELADLIASNGTELADDIAAVNTRIDGNDVRLDGLDQDIIDANGLITGLEDSKLTKSANLSDVVDAAAARTNLDVDSKGEVDAKINAAQLAMGTNFNTADLTTRDAMVDLDVADRVFVEDDGDGKWALYKVGTVNETGMGTSWIKIMDQDSLENSISKESIKTSYESNDDTNAYTDAEQTKVGLVSVTEAIDLDKVIQNDELNTSATLAGASDVTIASDLAVKTYIDAEAAKLLEITNNLSDVADVAAARTNLEVYSKVETDAAINTGGAIFKTETVIVVDDQITLSFAPKNGIVFNFTCVRHVDVNGVAYDIPTTPTADAKVFNIHPDASGEFDTKSVTVQYSHVAE
jgi:hypothetical protein